MQATLSWALFFFPPIATVAAESLGLDPIVVGYQAAIVFAMQMVGTLYSGLLLAKIGPVRGLQLSIAVTIVGCLLYLLPSVAAICAGSVLVGICHGLVNPGTAMILQRNPIPGRSGLIFSVKQASVPAGFMASSFIGPLIATEAGWRWSVLPLVLLLLVLLFALQSLMENSGKPSQAISVGWMKAPLDALRAMAGDRALLICTLAAMSFGFGQQAVLNFSSNMLVTEHNLSVVTAGLMLSWALAAAIGCRIVHGQLSDLFGSKRVMVMIGIGCLLLGVVLPLIGMIIKHKLLLGGLFMLLGGFAVSWNGVLMARIAELSSGSRFEQKQAGAYFLMFQSGVLGPLLLTLLYAANNSYTLSISIFLIVSGFSAACLTLIDTRFGTKGH